MTDHETLLCEIASKDERYPVDAYHFVQEAMDYAADSLELDSRVFTDIELETDDAPDQQERHLTGQQFCEAIRRYALNQYGYMAKVVLKNWNIEQTDCFGDIVYSMIDGGFMKKSTHDRRSHFDSVYVFNEVFENDFPICDSMAQRRS